MRAQRRTRCYSRRRGHVAFLEFIAHSAPAAAELCLRRRGLLAVSGRCIVRTLVIALKSLLMAACAAALFGVITLQVQRLDPLMPIAVPDWVGVAGLALMALGAGLALVCFWTFTVAGALSPHAHFPDPEGLITWGPF